MRPSTLAILLLGISVVANAGDADIAETARRLGYSVTELQEFLSHCDRDQYAMNICAVHGFIAEDIKLNKLYKRQLKLLKNSSEVVSLKKSQNAWLKFRQLDCEYVASPTQGGSIGIMLTQNCMRDRTIERIHHIESYLKCNSPGCSGDW